MALNPAAPAYVPVYVPLVGNYPAAMALIRNRNPAEFNRRAKNIFNSSHLPGAKVAKTNNQARNNATQELTDMYQRINAAMITHDLPLPDHRSFERLANFNRALHFNAAGNINPLYQRFTRQLVFHSNFFTNTLQDFIRNIIGPPFNDVRVTMRQRNDSIYFNIDAPRNVAAQILQGDALPVNVVGAAAESHTRVDIMHITIHSPGGAEGPAGAFHARLNYPRAPPGVRAQLGIIPGSPRNQALSADLVRPTPYRRFSPAIINGYVNFIPVRTDIGRYAAARYHGHYLIPAAADAAAPAPVRAFPQYRARFVIARIAFEMISAMRLGQQRGGGGNNDKEVFEQTLYITVEYQDDRDKTLHIAFKIDSTGDLIYTKETMIKDKNTDFESFDLETKACILDVLRLFNTINTIAAETEVSTTSRSLSRSRSRSTARGRSASAARGRSASASRAKTSKVTKERSTSAPRTKTRSMKRAASLKLNQE